MDSCLQEQYQMLRMMQIITAITKKSLFECASCSWLLFTPFSICLCCITWKDKQLVQSDKLWVWIRDLANDCYIASNNAYPLSNKILIPFTIKWNQIAGDVHKITYNFYLSQLQIQVEMAFGRMTQKFQIMTKKMTCSLATKSLYIQAITRLHNFIIDHDSLHACYGQPVNWMLKS
jgi:hypothetical protein